MSVPRVPEAWIRAQAEESGMTYEEARAYLIQGVWFRRMWELLRGTLDPDTPGLDLVAATEIRAELSLSAHAMTDHDYRDGDPIVRAHFGLPAWATELACTVTPFLVSPDNSRPVTRDAQGRIEWASPGIDLEQAAGRIAYSLSWLASRAGHPSALPQTPLSSEQERYAAIVSSAIVLFAAAHEMAHIRLGEMHREPSSERSRAREFAADLWALERMVALDEQKGGWPLRETLPAIAVFFWSNVIGDAYAAIEPTAKSSHPPFLERALALNARINELADEEARGMYAGAAFVLEALMPLIRARAPDEIAPAGELRRLLEPTLPEIAEEIAADITLTWRATYSLAVEFLLRFLASAASGPPTAEQIEPLESWLEREPGVVIDTLGAAYEGTLDAESDASLPPVRVLVKQMLPLLPEHVREAIIPG